jgi:hypothetical protein
MIMGVKTHLSRRAAQAQLLDSSHERSTGARDHGRHCGIGSLAMRPDTVQAPVSPSARRVSGKLSHAVGAMMGVERSLLCVCLLAVTACDREVARVPDPSGRMVAVVRSRNGGATTSVLYVVRLAERGQEWKGSQTVAELYGATVEGHSYGIGVRWVGSDTLELQASTVRDTSLLASVAEVAAINVHVRLVPYSPGTHPTLTLPAYP